MPRCHMNGVNAKQISFHTLDPDVDGCDLIEQGIGRKPAVRCKTCKGSGIIKSGVGSGNKNYWNARACVKCDGEGFKGIDPTLPCRSLQGTLYKSAVVIARRKAGLELWHEMDAREEE